MVIDFLGNVMNQGDVLQWKTTVVLEFKPHTKFQKTNNVHVPKNEPEQKKHPFQCETCGDNLESETLLSSNVHCKLCSIYWCAGSCGDQKMTCQYCGYKVIRPD